ncbi:MAG: 50S ribosomal protein L9 [Gammaproteobacteria bacterium]|nr:MAG: 50S ribosomal protein L9 [Gammaproteobacteria bacterium]
MEVILLEKIENLGGLGDKVSVKAGFARNYLVPSGKAKFATKANIEEFEARRAELEKHAAEALAIAQERKSKIEGMSLVIKAKAGSEGKLFGSISNKEIADAITARGVEVEKREIRMPEGPLRTIGEFTIGLHLHTDIDVTVNVTIEAED